MIQVIVNGMQNRVFKTEFPEKEKKMFALFILQNVSEHRFIGHELINTDRLVMNE